MKAKYKRLTIQFQKCQVEIYFGQNFSMFMLNTLLSNSDPPSLFQMRFQFLTFSQKNVKLTNYLTPGFVIIDLGLAPFFFFLKGQKVNILFFVCQIWLLLYCCLPLFLLFLQLLLLFLPNITLQMSSSLLVYEPFKTRK